MKLVLPAAGEDSILHSILATDFKIIDRLLDGFDARGFVHVNVQGLKNGSGQYFANGKPSLNSNGLPTTTIEGDLNTIIANLTAGGKGLVLYFPNGKYGVGGSGIWIRSNVHIVAEPYAEIIRVGGGRLLTNELDTAANGYTRSANMTVTGGIWNMKKDANVKNNGSVITAKTKEAILFANASQIRISDCAFKGVFGYSAILFVACKNAMVKACRFEESYKTTYDMAGKQYELISLYPNVTGSWDGSPTYAANSASITPCADIAIDGCLFETGEEVRGLIGCTKSANIPNDGLFISNCVFRQCDGQAIVLANTRNVSLIGSSFEVTGGFLQVREEGTISANSLYNYTLTGNRMLNYTTAAGLPAVEFTGLSALAGVNVTDNVFSNPTQKAHFLDFEHVENAAISGNVFDAFYRAINLDACAGLTVSGNTFRLGILNAFLASNSSSLLFSGNEIFNNASHSFRLNGGCSGFLVSSNLFSNQTGNAYTVFIVGTSANAGGCIANNVFHSTQAIKAVSCINLDTSSSSCMAYGNMMTDAYTSTNAIVNNGTSNQTTSVNKAV
jgi:hypothetical protein